MNILRRRALALACISAILSPWPALAQTAPLMVYDNEPIIDGLMLQAIDGAAYKPYYTTKIRFE